MVRACNWWNSCIDLSKLANHNGSIMLGSALHCLQHLHCPASRTWAGPKLWWVAWGRWGSVCTFETCTIICTIIRYCSLICTYFWHCASIIVCVTKILLVRVLVLGCHLWKRRTRCSRAFTLVFSQFLAYLPRDLQVGLPRPYMYYNRIAVDRTSHIAVRW